MIKNKIFIIGLPRTATTSVCAALLELGFKTAHTAYTKDTFEQAQVIADTPIFCDYPQLDKAYSDAKFIYLERDINDWLPSIKQLLKRMYINLQRSDGGFNPHLKRCYNEIFSPLTEENISNTTFLSACYQSHREKVIQYFSDRPNDLLMINVSSSNSYEKMLSFLQVTRPYGEYQGFKHINIAGKVTAWNDIKHDNKVPSTNQGRIDKIL